MIPKFQNRKSAYKIALIVAILTIITSACAPKPQVSTTAPGNRNKCSSKINKCPD